MMNDDVCVGELAAISDSTPANRLKSLPKPHVMKIFSANDVPKHPVVKAENDKMLE